MLARTEKIAEPHLGRCRKVRGWWHRKAKDLLIQAPTLTDARLAEILGIPESYLYQSRHWQRFRAGIHDAPKTRIHPDAMMLVIHQVAVMFGFSESGIRKLVKKGMFPKPMKIGKRVLWNRNELESFAKSGVI